MDMPGGGHFKLRSGQVTDDSEMSFHLMKALRHYDPRLPLSRQRGALLASIASEYVAWKQSKPFDIGITCYNGIKVLEAFQGIKEIDEGEKAKAIKTMFE
jgi:ADP-ribosyl-[dinitrogen reductase] hydrolase